MSFRLRFVLRALQFRRQRLLLSFSALAIAAALATVLFAINGSVERRLRDQFRSFGANITVVPLAAKTVPLEIVQAARNLGASASPYLVTAARSNGSVITVVGFDPKSSAEMTGYWKIEGSRDLAAGECLAGKTLKQKNGFQLGSRVQLGDSNCLVKGTVETGAVEDQELLVPFETASKLSGISDSASLIEVRAPGDRVEEIRSSLARQFPEAEVRTNRAVAETEAAVVLKIRAALFLVTFLILAITTLCVSSNFSEMVIERAKEIGTLKALGAVERSIASLFVSESAILALTATILGYGIGLLAASAIGRQVFGGVFEMQANWLVFAGVAGVMLAVAAVATSIAASRIWGVEPAIILRGE